MKAVIDPVTQLKLAKLAAACQHDPLLWAESAYSWGVPDTPLEHEDIRVWQADVMDDIATHLQNEETRHDPLFMAVASGHGIGKSACIGMVSNWAMSCFDRPRVVITANTENQLRTKTSPEVGQWFRWSVSRPLFNIDTMRISLAGSAEASQWAIDFTPWSEHNTEAFAGLHAKGRIVLLIMDEGSAISDKVWEVAEGALTDENTVLIWLVFGNPTQNTGRFRECFRRNRKQWKTYQIDSRSVEGTNKKALQALVDRHGEDSDVAKVRVKGQFPSASSRQLIPTDLVDAAFGRHLDKHQYDFAARVLTCDPAWTGDDDLVIAFRQGLMFKILDTIPKNTNDVFIAQKIANYEIKLQADAVFIDLGWGTGIKSAGDTMGRAWQLIAFSDAAANIGFINKRAEMWQAIADWLEAGGAIPEDQELYEDLIGVQTKPRPDGKIQLVSKEDMKKEGLPSPNKGDALALSFAHPVERRRHPVVQQAGPSLGNRVQQTEYDPFSQSR